MAFWKEMQKAFTHMKYKQSVADSCFYWKYLEEEKLMVWLTWVDNCVLGGPKGSIIVEKKWMQSLFDCDAVGQVREYIGNKVEVCRKRGIFKINTATLH